MTTGVVLVVRLLRHRRARPAPAGAGRPSTIDVTAELPTFNIIALGAQETGKTVLLASMFHRLSTELREGGFRLVTGLEQAADLTDLYATLRDPGDAWPPGTMIGQTRSFSFDCVGTAGGRDHAVLRFNYLDYAGELVGGGRAASVPVHGRQVSQQDLEQRLDAAHAIFGIIDGRRMVDALRGGRDGQLYLENTIVPMIVLMRRAECPVHFVLTKWDLFDTVGADEDEENDRLELARKELLSYPPIRNLVEQRRRTHKIVRLIPVSAIGRQFATMTEDGHMVKLPHGRLRPVNVELPLCAVLPDLFAQVSAKLDAAVERKIAEESRALSRLSLTETMSAVGRFLARPTGQAVRLAADLAVGRNVFSEQIVGTFLDWIGEPFEAKAREVAQAIDDAHRSADQIRLARQAVLEEFRENMVVLRRQLPASDLTTWGVR
ncbi:hypothetical protein [Plantactinospora endophytica]|uniref:hypothetical protein n=1 Tax=Plantactinospora endophytica TaxID=673535 RepID=UPI0019416D2A|nr:hypothetical protein [Plantactinospora endophytica]